MTSPQLAQTFSTNVAPAWSAANDIAMNSSISASSETTGSLAKATIDGVVDGYGGIGGDASKEWASNGQGVGAWLQMSWPAPISITDIILYDRPNLNVRALSLSFACTPRD